MRMMDKFDNNAEGAAKPVQTQAVDAAGGTDAELEQALKDFKSSVHAWSDAAYSRPRSLAQQVRHRSWRLALGWALGGLLVAATVSGGLVERQHKLELARAAAQQRAAAAQQEQTQQQAAAKEDEEDLLAQVDSDVSRQVPSALEPLAQMMTDEETK